MRCFVHHQRTSSGKWSRGDILVTRQVTESIWIMKQKNCMNRDASACNLSHVYDCHVTTCVMKFADDERNVAHKY